MQLRVHRIESAHIHRGSGGHGIRHQHSQQRAHRQHAVGPGSPTTVLFHWARPIRRHVGQDLSQTTCTKSFAALCGMVGPRFTTLAAMLGASTWYAITPAGPGRAVKPRPTSTLRFTSAKSRLRACSARNDAPLALLVGNAHCAVAQDSLRPSSVSAPPRQVRNTTRRPRIWRGINATPERPDNAPFTSCSACPFGHASAERVLKPHRRRLLGIPSAP